MIALKSKNNFNPRTVLACGLVFLLTIFKTTISKPIEYNKNSYQIFTSVLNEMYSDSLTDSILIYNNDKYKFSFKYPQTWSIMTPEEATKRTQGHFDAKAVVYVINERDFDCNINIQVIPFEKEELTISDLNEIRGYLDSEYPKVLPEYKKISSKIITLNDINAIEYVYEVKRLDLTLQQKMVQLVKHKRAYTFTFTSPKQKYEKSDSKCFSVILSTLEIK